jgi:hypothetical protein
MSLVQGRFWPRGTWPNWDSPDSMDTSRVWEKTAQRSNGEQTVETEDVRGLSD